MGKARTLLLVVTEDWYLASHRLPLIRASVKAGWNVLAVTRIRDHGAQIAAAGAELIPLPISREGRNPLRELAGVRTLAELYRERCPDIVHHVGIKPILYGGWAARWAGCPRVVQAFAGLGHLYTSDRAGLTRSLVNAALRPVTRARCTRILVQNADDAAVLEQHGVAAPGAIRIIRGGGVDLQRFAPSALPGGDPAVILPARMLATKGVREFIAAARHLRKEGCPGRFVLAGRIDPANPDSLTATELQSVVDEGVVEWLDHVESMPELFRMSSIVALPSYREGMPKSLLEAAACGRPIVATDVPGCRDIVRHGWNGMLVPPRDSHALASALRDLIEDRALRELMGQRGRERAEKEFSDVAAADQTVALYDELMACLR